MNTLVKRWPWRLATGLLMGMIITLFDNLLYEGEVSTIVIAMILLIATVTFGVMWGLSGWIAATATWVWVPGTHFVLRVFGLPDTLHPNTFSSIAKLAAFSLLVSSFGLVCGIVLRWLMGKR